MREQLPTLMKEAMKAGDKKRLGAIRLIGAAMKDREIEARGLGKEMTEEDEQAVLRKMVKQRQDSIVAYEAAGREELAAQERDEVAVLSEFLPQQMDEAGHPGRHRRRHRRDGRRRPQGHGQGHRGREGQACRPHRLRQGQRHRQGAAGEARLRHRPARP